MSQKVRTIFGAMGIGSQLGSNEAIQCFDKFKTIGNEIDTAVAYNNGKSEKVIGEVLKSNPSFNFLIATKANPWWDPKTNTIVPGQQKGGLSPTALNTQLSTSLGNLQMDKVSLYYLHAPDHSTSLEDTVKAVHELHQQGKFDEWGLSNFHSDTVLKVYELCKSNGWKPPTVYQGMYNCITRAVEKDLFPVLRQCGIRFYAYNPLAGGLLTGKYKFEEKPSSGRFNKDSTQGKMYGDRYWNKDVFDAIEKILEKAIELNLTMVEIAFAWMYHHSKLSGEHGDGVIIGVSSVDHLTKNVDICNFGQPLPDAVLKAIDEAWKLVEPICPKYYR